jgi:hypothetical protein
MRAIPVTWLFVFAVGSDITVRSSSGSSGPSNSPGPMGVVIYDVPALASAKLMLTGATRPTEACTCTG